MMILGEHQVGASRGPRRGCWHAALGSWEPRRSACPAGAADIWTHTEADLHHHQHQPRDEGRGSAAQRQDRAQGTQGTARNAGSHQPPSAPTCHGCRHDGTDTLPPEGAVAPGVWNPHELTRKRKQQPTLSPRQSDMLDCLQHMYTRGPFLLSGLETAHHPRLYSKPSMYTTRFFCVIGLSRTPSSKYRYLLTTCLVRYMYIHLSCPNAASLKP